MTPDDKALLSVLLDDEASPDEVARALALLERKPDLMDYVERHQWIRAHWQKEYAGPQLDLRAGIWDKIAADASASEAGLVDELALRREARGLAKVMSQPEDDEMQTTVIEVDGPLASRDSNQESVSDEAQPEQQVVAMAGDVPVAKKRWWQPVAQMAVAASVCFGVVGLWYFDQPANTLAPTTNLVAGTDTQAVPFNDEVARSQTAVASQLAASNNRAKVASTAPVTSTPVVGGIGQGANLILPSAAQGIPQIALEQPLSDSMNFVSLESLAAKERARLQSYYMMHTGNSALMQPVQGMQLVRIVDTPPSPQLRSTGGQ